MRRRTRKVPTESCRPASAEDCAIPHMPGWMLMQTSQTAVSLAQQTQEAAAFVSQQIILDCRVCGPAGTQVGILTVVADGGASPLGPPWQEVMTHIADRLSWTDPAFRMQACLYCSCRFLAIPAAAQAARLISDTIFSRCINTSTTWSEVGVLHQGDHQAGWHRCGRRASW